MPRRAQQLGRYFLLDRIAFGGMAEIYRARTFDEEGRATFVAVKRVLPHLVEDPDFLTMLVDEARIVSGLHHPNVAEVYEFARIHNEYVLAMEYVDGRDLRAVLERCRKTGRPLAPELAAYVAAEVALGLHAAHSLVDAARRPLCIVHRDVSPSNVICAYNGEVKLCDFGIAKATLSRVRTRAGMIKGKVKYMSPEQALGKKLDHRSDLFSLGAVLHEMLTLTPPFVAPSEMELLVRVRDARCAPLAETAPYVPAGLAAIVEHALARARARRFQTGEEMAAALTGFLRTYAPGAGRNGLSRFLRATFAEEIDRSLRLVGDFVLEASDAGDVGENLIADVLPPGAPYARFRPVATQTGTPAPAPASDFHDAETGIIEAGERRPVDVHDAPTLIIRRK